MLSGRKILLGITGSIAAYKAAVLARALVKEGAEVKVIMTTLAKEFITPLTMATVSKNPILVDFFDPEDGRWNSHVSLGEWADAFLIAPATANTISKMAAGIADNLLLTTYLSARCPVFIAPAMDLDMFSHPATTTAMDMLRSRSVNIIEPEAGELASGLIGKGRMAEPEHIVEQLTFFFAQGQKLAGRKVIVTAGATREPIDPVRFISNYSSGKMGYHIADQLRRHGAHVILITGAATVTPPLGVETIRVDTAEQMYEECKRHFTEADAAVMCAAVADYKPTEYSEQKIKKDQGQNPTLQLKQNPDIAAALGEIKGDRLLVGFALESDNGVPNALVKLHRKNLDFIVLNSLEDTGVGFGTDTNKITIIDRSENIIEYPLMPKSEVASVIAERIFDLITSHT